MTTLHIPPTLSAPAHGLASDAIAVRTALSCGPSTLAALKRARTLQARSLAEGKALLLQMGLLIAATEKAEREAAKRPSLDAYNEAVKAAREADIEEALAGRKLEQA